MHDSFYDDYHPSTIKPKSRAPRGSSGFHWHQRCSSWSLQITWLMVYLKLPVCLLWNFQNITRIKITIKSSFHQIFLHRSYCIVYHLVWSKRFNQYSFVMFFCIWSIRVFYIFYYGTTIGPHHDDSPGYLHLYHCMSWRRTSWHNRF